MPVAVLDRNLEQDGLGLVEIRLAGGELGQGHLGEVEGEGAALGGEDALEQRYESVGDVSAQRAQGLETQPRVATFQQPVQRLCGAVPESEERVEPEAQDPWVVARENDLDHRRGGGGVREAGHNPEAVCLDIRRCACQGPGEVLRRRSAGRSGS